MNLFQLPSLRLASFCSYALFFFIVPLSVFAQPSGGPYGPIEQTYIVPGTPFMFITSRLMAKRTHPVPVSTSRRLWKRPSRKW